MTLRFCGRPGIFAVALALGTAACVAVASAAVVMSTGIRYVVPTAATPDECSAKAQKALSAYLQSPSEPTAGSGEWLAFGPIGGVGPATAASVVSCYPVGKGYVVTFTCVVQLPGNPYAADALCLDVAHNFSGKAVTPLAAPTPIPSGCTTANLVGTWTSDNKPGLTFTMEANGDLTDSDGVSGNWILYNGSVTLTYYGNHSMTLASDGKHLTGGGYSLTRKC